DDKYKIVIYLYYYEDYSVSQIADCLKLTSSNVKTRLKRARDILKIELED
ncbi:MAG: RNA polymerase subunit sigma, partial [Eubacterium sp.]|nr:RNA polymerase subunit sigma [Eubacterium sp.]